MLLRTQPQAATAATKSSPSTGRRRVAHALLGWSAFAAIFVSSSARAAPMQYNQGNPTDAEQYLLLKLNLARRDPVGEGTRLAAYLRTDPIGKAVVAQYGTNPDQVAADFAALPAVAPLAFNADLISAARSHSVDLAAHNGVGPGGTTVYDDGKLGPDGVTPIGHLGYDGSTPDSRVTASGFRSAEGDDGFAGENFDPDSTALDDDHAGYLIDWGNPDLGHRKLSMNGSNGNNVVGIGVASFVGTTNGSFVGTEDYGQPGLTVINNVLTTPDIPALLTGVVYTDKNGNGQYDPGEGVAGVTVSMDAGAYYAVTTSSGGFSLPLVNADGSNASGAVVVRTRNVPGESADRTAVVHIANVSTDYGPYRANVEWDVVPGHPAAGVAAGPSLAAFFDGAAALGNDWYYLAFAEGDLFGYYNVAAYPYVLHNDLGWEYVLDANDGKAGVYLYDFASASWWYTSPGFGFPYLYDFTRHAVLYYYPASGQPGYYSSGPRYFYDFAAQQVIPL